MMVALLMLVGLTVAASPDQAVVEREAKQIERMLIAPCCWTQPVSKHFSGAAAEIRQGIRQMLSEGKTRQRCSISTWGNTGSASWPCRRPRGST